MTDALVIREDLSVQFLPQAEALKADALEKAAVINRVRNAAENEAAAEAFRALKTLKDDVEKTRVALTAPYLRVQRELKRTADEFTTELNAESLRIGKLLGDFATLEAARLKSEEAARLQCLSDVERRREAELAAATSHEERDAIQERYCDIAATVPQVKAPVRATGQVVKTDWAIEVTDANTLARFHPNCVTIKPKLTEIKAMLDSGLTVNGVRAERVTSTTVRAQKESEAIAI